jgi:PBP1b-binding outer membrane lipoprotein LpoB
MKKTIKIITALIIAATLSSCATVFGGKVSTYQKTKPAAGQPQRSVRVAALICDIILFWPGTIVDFATGAIYKPEGK